MQGLGFRVEGLGLRGLGGYVWMQSCNWDVQGSGAMCPED